MADHLTIKTLWDKKHNKMKIAELTGHDWKTVDKVVRFYEKGEEPPGKKPHPCILDSQKEQILQWLEENLTSRRIHDKLIDSGLKISYSAVKSFVSKIKKRQQIFVRIHTPAGEEAQVDFGYVGFTLDNQGKKRKTWVFNLRLSYSRMDYYEAVYDQRVETFIQCHINAFKYLKGVPECIKIDNLKAAILEANFYEPIYQEMYKRFAEFYDFKPLPCRIYHPNDKGKVESGVKYVKTNFFLGRHFKNTDDLKRQLSNWLNKTCNSRLHGTTRKIPFEVFEKEEKHKLKSLPLEEFKMSELGTRKVYHDCHIYVGYNYYSVPFEYVGEVVEIELSKTLVKIFKNGKLLAVHNKSEGKGDFITNQSHYPKYKSRSNTEFQEKYQTKMAQIGPYVEQMFFQILEKQPNSWSKSVSGILSLSKQFTKEIVNLSCKRALAYDVYQYSTIKNICKNGTYNLPLEFNVNVEENFYEYA